MSYAVAMGAGAVANFLLGDLYDRVGFPVGWHSGASRVLVTLSVVGQLLSVPLFFIGRTASQTASR